MKMTVAHLLSVTDPDHWHRFCEALKDDPAGCWLVQIGLWSLFLLALLAVSAYIRVKFADHIHRVLKKNRCGPGIKGNNAEEKAKECIDYIASRYSESARYGMDAWDREQSGDYFKDIYKQRREYDASHQENTLRDFIRVVYRIGYEIIIVRKDDVQRVRDFLENDPERCNIIIALLSIGSILLSVLFGYLIF